MVENVDAGRPRTFPALTGLRFFAALAVFMFHYGAGFAGRLHAPGPLVQLLRNGNIGVSLFFVLSGFVLMHTYYAKRFNKRFLFDFLLARFARVYPVYALVLLIAVPVSSSKLDGVTVARVLLMIQAWTPAASSKGGAWIMQAWTLSAEMFFYILFPVILVLLRNMRGALIGGIVVVAAGMILLTASPFVAPGTFTWRGVPAWLPELPMLRLTEFVYGAAIYCVYTRSQNLSRVISRAVFINLCIAISVGILCFSGQPNIKSISTILFGLLVYQLASGDSGVPRILGSSPLTFLGGASYAIYLFQGPMRAYCSRLIVAPLDEIVCPLATGLVSVIVFTCWEQPVRRMILQTYHRLTRPLHIGRLSP